MHHADTEIAHEGLFRHIAELKVLCAQHLFARKRPGAKRKIQVFDFYQFFAFFHLGKSLDARLHQIGQAGFGPKTGNELLHLPAAVQVRAAVYG